MWVELTQAGLNIIQQLTIVVEYRGEIVGERIADQTVNNPVLVEIKTRRVLAEEHEAQLLNYLEATTFEVGSLLNFGPKAEFKLRVFENSRKERYKQDNNI